VGDRARTYLEALTVPGPATIGPGRIPRADDAARGVIVAFRASSAAALSSPLRCSRAASD
jgi:hypothetical protein